MNIDKETFEVIAKAARYNSGRALCDSGDHEKPAIEETKNPTQFEVWQRDGEKPDITACMEVCHFLASRCTHRKDLQDQFSGWIRENSELNWFEAGEKFMGEEGKYEQFARDNVYNGENDLSQVYVWEVYATRHDGSYDWIYADSAVLVVYIHTGCDVRGGYSYPVFLESDGDYAAPFDLCCEASIEEAREQWVENQFESDGTIAGNITESILNFFDLPVKKGWSEMSREEAQSLDETWRNGYTSCPIYEFSNDVKRVFFSEKTQHLGYLLCLLNSGQICKVRCDMPYAG